MRDNLGIFIINKNASLRRILSSIISSIAHAELIGIASSGKFALSKIALSKPDLVLLDTETSEKDSINTLRQINNNFPDIEVVMISGESPEDADTTVKALETGAIDFIPRLKQETPKKNLNELTKALTPILKLAITRKHCKRIKDSTSSTKAAPPIKKPLPSSPKPGKSLPPKKVEAIAIAVSTGGPNALMNLIPCLEPDFPVPILAVQHMPSMFISSLAKRLNLNASIPVIEGKKGQKIEKGAMYLAPGGSHLVVKKSVFGKISLNLEDSAPVNSCKPSADVLFKSIRKVYGGKVITVILTGMGKDGAEGVAQIRKKGGYSIVQDEKTSVIWGMPGEVVKAGNADEILSLEKIAARITELVNKAKS